MTAIKHKVVDHARVIWHRMGKDDKPMDELEKIIAELFPDGLFIGFSDFMHSELENQYRDSGLELLSEVGMASQSDMLDFVNQEAIKYANERAAELVGNIITTDDTGAKVIVPNPNPVWNIAESTRDMMRPMISNAIEEGYSAQDLADELGDSFAFSDTRAMTIARTELASAYIDANRQTATESGAVAKKSYLGSEHDHAVPAGDECDDAADDGIIAIGDEYSNGADGPPYHPNCCCDQEWIYDDDPRVAGMFGIGGDD